MIGIKTLLGIIRTEAVEFGGQLEVPDRMDGAIESYHSAKRNARHGSEGTERKPTENRAPIRHTLELIRAEDGTLKWVE